MLDKGIASNIFRSLPTAQFFIIASIVSGVVLLARQVKPVASCVLALSIPGTIGAVVTFALCLSHFPSGPSAAKIPPNLMFALIVTAAFPSYLISPGVFIASLRRYRSNKDDYSLGFGVITVACLLVAAAVLSHVLATHKDETIAILATVIL